MTYQNIKIEGKDFGKDIKRDNSIFFNEKKWDRFIKPLLPKDCEDMTFVELGCDAGMYLKLAKKMGFKKVLGIEQDRHSVKMGEKYRGDDDYKIIRGKINEYFDFSVIPATDVLLMSNFHYHLHIKDFVALMDYIKNRVSKVLIVSADAQFRRGLPDGGKRASNNFWDIKYYFRDWIDAGSIREVYDEKDPTPRKMWSILFESKDIRRVNINSIWKSQGYSQDSIELIKKVVNEETIDDIKSLKFYDKISRFSGDRKAYMVAERVEDRINMLKSVFHEGLLNPILIKSDGELLDGTHRWFTQKAMGYKTILARVL